MRVNKTQKVTFRAGKTFVDFLDSMSKSMDIERSELIRTVLTYFFMSNQLGKLGISYDKLTEEFLLKAAKPEEPEKVTEKVAEERTTK